MLCGVVLNNKDCSFKIVCTEEIELDRFCAELIVCLGKNNEKSKIVMKRNKVRHFNENPMQMIILIKSKIN